MRKVLEDTRPGRNPPDVSNSGIRVFVYAVGSKIPDHAVLDVFAALHALAPPRAPTAELGGGFARLNELAQRYGRTDWGRWAHKFVDEKAAGILADELSRDPMAAQELAELLPTNLLRAGLGAGVGAVSRALNLGYETNLQKARNKALDLIARGRVSTAEDAELWLVSERLAEADSQPPALSLSEASHLYEQITGGGDLGLFNRYVFGSTPMREALKTIRERFARERSRYPHENRLLFLLSDGEPTDGDPTAIAEVLKSSGVLVISCFVTGEDLVRPRTLYSAPAAQWSKGARLMFEISSPLTQETAFAQYLSERGWDIGPGARMFMQANHSEVLDDVLRALLCLAEDTVG